MLDAQASVAVVFAGAVSAAAVLVVVVILMRKAGDKLKPGPLLTAAGALLCVLAVILAGKGVRSLQEAGLIGIEPLVLPRFDWIGLYPTMQTVAAQAAVLATFAAIAVWSMRSQRSS
jgi:high-affinity iron transporter